MRKSSWIPLVVILLALAAGACKPKVEKLAADKGLSDEKALEAMAAEVWNLYIGDSRRIAVSKKANGKYLVEVRIVGGGLTVAKNLQSYREIELITAAQYLWRMVKYGSHRNLDEVALTFGQKVTGGNVVPVYRVRLSVDQLKRVSDWDADPYNVDSNDLLDESVRHVPKEIRKVWTMDMDNFAALKL